MNSASGDRLPDGQGSYGNNTFTAYTSQGSPSVPSRQSSNLSMYTDFSMAAVTSPHHLGQSSYVLVPAVASAVPNYDPTLDALYGIPLHASPRLSDNNGVANFALGPANPGSTVSTYPQLPLQHQQSAFQLSASRSRLQVSPSLPAMS
jgi:hypothetical protein